MTATQPTSEQAAAMAAGDMDQPVAMVNLLKFKDKATYADDAAEAAENLTGGEAYARYGAGVFKVLSKIGAKSIFFGPAAGYVIGDGEDWDSVAIVWYPSRKAFLEMPQREDYQAIHYHRAAGLEHQQLITTTPGEL